MDFLVIGAGFFGATVANLLASSGRNVLVLDKRSHIGGNCYSKIDKTTGVECHEYGSHIFHTSNEKVWAFLNHFTQFNTYQHTVWTTFKSKIYSMPINLATINSFYGKSLKPYEVEAFIKREQKKEGIKNPVNLEEKAISMIGRPLYEAFIKGYTIKQWEKNPCDLSPDIITRLPVRHNYSNRYFNDKYEGIPIDGYSKLFERLFDHRNIEVRLNTDFFDIKQDFDWLPTLYTGPIDRFFNYKFGHLDWRTIDFDRKTYEIEDYQGCSVMNFADEKIPFTRIHEFKHLHPERVQTDATVTFREFSRIAAQGDEPYYPVNTHRNSKLLKLYQNEAKACKNIWFGGRLGSYRYFDMDKTIASAIEIVDILKGIK